MRTITIFAPIFAAVTIMVGLWVAFHVGSLFGQYEKPQLANIQQTVVEEHGSVLRPADNFKLTSEEIDKINTGQYNIAVEHITGFEGTHECLTLVNREYETLRILGTLELRHE